MKPLPKNDDEIQFFLFLYIHDIFESYYNVILNPFNPSNIRETLQSQHFPPALNAANSRHFAKLIILPTCGTVCSL